MSISYKLVQWTPHKRVYDLLVVVGVLAYIGCFFAVAKIMGRNVGDEVLLIRALGTCAIVMLHIILCIGPLARLDHRFLPLLFNRRHLGVTMFLVALAHGVASIGYYHGFGTASPLISLLTSNTNFRCVSAFPFELLGVAALLILFVMAATSHDFWLKNLTPRVWKSLHMLVYVAWALLVMHVALGAMQSEPSIVHIALLLGGAVIVIGLHLVAGARENSRPTHASKPGDEEWINVAHVDDVAEGCAKIVRLADGAGVAIFRHEGAFSALSNVCAHQQGPLGEGRIVNGCVTCPWHGYQYRANDGCSPPPFTEKVPTYRLRVISDKIMLDPRALPPGTSIQPAALTEADRAK